MSRPNPAVPRTFRLPLWVLVREPHVWATGLPGAVQLVGDGAEWLLPVFTRRRRADELIAARRLRRVRPLAVGDGMVMEAVATHYALGCGAAVALDFGDRPGGFAVVPVGAFVRRLPGPTTGPRVGVAGAAPSEALTQARPRPRP